MKQLQRFFLIALLPYVGFCQDIVCSLEDKNAFAAKIEAIQELKENEIGAVMVAVGKTFLEAPYVAKTLEIGETEALVINLQGLDCTTFVENVLTYSLMLHEDKKDFTDFVSLLETIRYKDGKLDGYASRLHYFSEWIANNAKKGIIKDMTAEIGGRSFTKEIDFMSTHRELYPFLKDAENYEKIKASEAFLNLKPICVLPQEDIESQEHLIQSGDIIALTTSIKGLDITHTGIATREADGRIHLLHASTGSKKVEVSTLPLAEYLKKIKHNTGIMVARVIL